MRIAVIGGGAAGTLFSFLVQEAGCEVVVYEKRSERRRELERHVSLRGTLEGEAVFRVRAPGEPDAPFDVMVLAVPAEETPAALRSASPFVHRDTFYLSLQEGFAWEIVEEMVGRGRAAAALSWVSSRVLPDGGLEVEEIRRVVFGAGEGGPIDGVENLCGVLRSRLGEKAAVTGDLRGETCLRTAVVWPVGALCSILDSPPVEAVKRKEAVDICGRALEEAENALGLRARITDAWEESVWKRIPPPMPTFLRRDGRSEGAFLGGRILREAGAKGFRPPVTSALFSLVRELETGRMKPGERCLRELVRRLDEEEGMSLL